MNRSDTTLLFEFVVIESLFAVLAEWTRERRVPNLEWWESPRGGKEVLQQMLPIKSPHSTINFGNNSKVTSNFGNLASL
jgi:hypothetical protein